MIIDDQMAEAGDSKMLSNLFTMGAHHNKPGVMYLVQNVYNKTRNQRTVSINPHYNVVFRNERDVSQFRALAYQMHVNNSNWLLDAFEDATMEPFGYQGFDYHPTNSRDMRVITNIQPNKELIVYIKPHICHFEKLSRYNFYY